METATSDAANWFGLLVMAGLALGFGLMAWFLVIKPDRIDAKGLEALAARRGWLLTRHSVPLGKGFRVQLAPQDGAGWTCEVTRQSRSSSGSTVRTTEFQTPRRLLDRGMVVIGPPIAADQARTAERLLSQMGGMLQEMLLKQILGADAASHAAGLRLVPDAPPGVTVFATEGVLAPDLAQLFLTLTADWRTRETKERAFPILIATPTCSRLRLRLDASNPQLLERFLDSALQLHDALERP